jgi:pyridoxine/pyridoxamine 5'-phosphate oxidase
MDTKGLLAFLRQQRLAVQASVSAANHPQAAVVGCAVTDRFEVVFDTLISTRKCGNLRQNPRIALVLGGVVPGEERTVQYEGITDEPSGDELERLKLAYYEVYPDGRSRLAWPGLVYVRVRPTWIRYCDYGVDPPEIVEFTQDDLAAMK